MPTIAPTCVSGVSSRRRSDELSGSDDGAGVGVLRVATDDATRRRHVARHVARRRLARLAAPRRGLVGERGQLGSDGVDVDAGLRGARQPEVEHAHAPVGAEDQVGRLEVAVHEADLVRRGQAAPGVAEDVQHLAPRRPLALIQASPVSPCDQLHRQEHAAVDAADVVDGDDVGMRQLRQRLRLAQQRASPACRVAPRRSSTSLTATSRPSSASRAR